MAKICTSCGTKTTKPKRITKGSILIEIVLWLCFLVPGLIYSLWRLSTRHDACPSCGSSHLVDENSPVGKRMAA